ncbi:MAG: hypothetical protein AB7W16_15115 [Candidatus Obscuribacterales bacterium]
MNRRLILAIIALLPWLGSQAALAAEKSPFNVPDSLALSQAPAGAIESGRLEPVIPLETSTTGVDIVDDSLKYHSVMDPSMGMPMTLNGNAQMNRPLVGAGMINQVPMQQAPMMPQQASPTQMQAVSAPVSTSPASTAQAASQGSGPSFTQKLSQSLWQQVPTISPVPLVPMTPYMQPAYMPSPYMPAPVVQVDTKRAIGLIGATALMGAFVHNGGVGGLMKSLGMDNQRHIRGNGGF